MTRDSQELVPGSEGDTETEPSQPPSFELSSAVAGVVPDDTFTVDQAVDALGFGKFQSKLSLLTGLCWMADSMELMILAILGPALRCEWHLTEWQQAGFTAAVFAGMMVSATFWGSLSDKYGRRRSLRLASLLLAYWGVLAALAPTYGWLLFLRALVGFAMGCIPQSVTLYAEFLPAKHRGRCVVFLDCFWALGACLEVLLAMLVMPTLGWQWLLAFSAIPSAVFVVAAKWLPESARFEAASGKSEKAWTTLETIAQENGKPMLLGRLIVDDVSHMLRGRISNLLLPNLKRTTLLLWYIWFACTFCYYGVVLLTTELLRASQTDPCHAAAASQQQCAAVCRPLVPSDYLHLLWTTLAEFPGILITVPLLERIGRKKTMALEFSVFLVAISLLSLCSFGRGWLTFILFVARGVISGVFQAAFVYTPEVYPTSLRSVGVGTCSGLARLGAMATPIVALVLSWHWLKAAAMVYGFVALLAAIASLMLPIETHNRAMA